jgi:hypothetical protein
MQGGAQLWRRRCSERGLLTWPVALAKRMTEVPICRRCSPRTIRSPSRPAADYRCEVRKRPRRECERLGWLRMSRTRTCSRRPAATRLCGDPGLANYRVLERQNNDADHRAVHAPSGCGQHAFAVLQAVTSWGWPSLVTRPPLVQAPQYSLVQAESGLLFEDGGDDSWQGRADLRRKVCELLDLSVIMADEDDGEPEVDRPSAPASSSRRKQKYRRRRPGRNTLASYSVKRSCAVNHLRSASSKRGMLWLRRTWREAHSVPRDSSRS